MTTTDTPRRTTGHPAKDSGGGTIADSRLPHRMAVWKWIADGRRGHMPIPPDDYARHWELEGPC